MKYCIAVQETLRREIVVEADSLEDALIHFLVLMECAF